MEGRGRITITQRGCTSKYRSHMKSALNGEKINSYSKSGQIWDERMSNAVVKVLSAVCQFALVNQKG